MTNRITTYNGKAGTLYTLKDEYGGSTLGIHLDGDDGLRPCRFHQEDRTYDNCTQSAWNGEKGYWHYDNEYLTNALLKLVGEQAGNIVGINGCKVRKFEITE